MIMLVKVLIFFTFLAISSAKVSPKVKCTSELMRIEIPISASTKRVYLDSLRDYPDPACRPHTDPTGTLAVLELDLRDVYRCAVTRVVNKQTGKQIYYQTLVIENEENERETRETLHVKCSMLSLRNHTITRRDLLPAGFQEPEDLEFTSNYTKHAPEPILGVGVRQAGKLVTGELNVSPGTPLQMEIFLDKTSAPIYGLLVTHMQVTDTNSQEETIIYNGCSVDPYLFENFNTVDGDFLAAKFRAFKFPESTYVQFKGTVNVCLDKCKGVECSDGQIGYGRKRRAISSNPNGPNGLFEITITSFIKVDYKEGSENLEELDENQTRIYNNKKLIVECSPELMRIEVPISASTKRVYLDSLRNYPDPACKFHTNPNGTLAVLELNLKTFYQCAVTRVVNKQTGQQIYYQTIVKENKENKREIRHVECYILPLRNHNIIRRDLLWPEFEELEGDADFIRNITEYATKPILDVGIRQSGKLVKGELNVSPGTPLQMEIFLDKISAPIYGLLVTHLQGTDTISQEETVIYNGCSVDPYLFENFNTVDGDFLVAKFKAFKFPESSYVLFKGTVDVCLDKCKGVECSDGQIGYGRKKRAISSNLSDSNDLFEISFSLLMKVGKRNESKNLEEPVDNRTRIFNNKKLVVGNEMMDTRQVYETVNNNDLKSLETRKERFYTSIVADNSSTRNCLNVTLVTVLCLFRMFL